MTPLVNRVNMNFCVYVIQNPEGKKYIGQTSDLGKRIEQHNDPENQLSKFAKRYKGPWKLVYSESFDTRLEALRREKFLKSGQGREFIKQHLKHYPRYLPTAD